MILLLVIIALPVAIGSRLMQLRRETVKFEIERRGEPYWWAYKVGDYTEPVLLKAIEMYEMMMGWGEEIMSAPPAPEQ